MFAELKPSATAFLQAGQDWIRAYGQKKTSQTTFSPFDFEPASVRGTLGQQVLDVKTKVSAQRRASIFGLIVILLLVAESILDVYKVFADYIAPFIEQLGPLCLTGINACLDLNAPHIEPTVRPILVGTLRVLTFTMGIWSTFRVWDIAEEIRTTSNQSVRTLVQEALATRNIYVGSGRFSVSIGETGLALHSNNLQYDADWFAFDFDRFVRRNVEMPNIELEYYRGRELMKIVDRIGLDDYAAASVEAIERWAHANKEIRLFVRSNYNQLHKDVVDILKFVDGPEVRAEVAEILKLRRDHFENEPNNQLPWPKFVVACYFGIALNGQT